ncbi:hypothetical protein [Planctomycetes bacterium K23_9]|uniref:Uncharacterized protein n=1 Tax=Stieleria marina TaxID=1930275 RepID=A0A517NWH5_9BACT|nr:hypothetical protein K239x_34670 [Planctomycetes bacterium K23_9]
MLRIIMLPAIVCLVGASGWTQEYGRSSTYKIRRIIGQVPPRPPILGPSKIEDVQTMVGGTFIELQFKTTHAVRGLVLWTNRSTGVAGSRMTANGKKHKLLVENLSPDSDYRFQIYQLPIDPLPVDLHTHEFQRTTLQKNVTCFVENIYMLDDSDELSAGEFFFNFILGSKDANFNESGNAWDAFGTPLVSIHSGTNLALMPAGITNVLSADNVHSPDLKFAVSAFEDDGLDGFLGLPPRAPKPDLYVGSYDHGVTETNSGFLLTNISGSALTPNANTPQKRESLNKSFDLYVPPSSESDLSYAISGWIVVSYAAPNQ